MHILIVGSGIAGPALAFWLQRQGVRATVIERAPSLREGGYCVDIRGAALEVVERMGLRDAMRPFEADTLHNAVVDEKGRIFGRTDRGFGVIDAGDVEIPRGDLTRLLYDATRAAVDYRFGESVASLSQHAKGVDVTFTSGATETFDAVVGADGVHSRTRALAFGPEQDFLRPMGSALAVFSVPNHIGMDREQLLFMDVSRVASVKSANGNRTLTISVFYPLSDAGSFDHRDVSKQRMMFATAFESAAWEFPRFIAAMSQAEDFYSDLTCQVGMDALHRGRVALVGDAAYCASPMTGQGTSLAIVGAYVLAHELARDREPVAAFARYTAVMQPFARRNQEIAWKVGSRFAPGSGFQVRAARLAMRILPHLPGSSWIMKMSMKGVRDAARSLQLPREAAHPQTKHSTLVRQACGR